MGLIHFRGHMSKSRNQLCVKTAESALPDDKIKHLSVEEALKFLKRIEANCRNIDDDEFMNWEHDGV